MNSKTVSQTVSIEEAKELFRSQGAAGNRSQQSVDVYLNGVAALQWWCEENGHTTTEDLTMLNIGDFNPWIDNVDEWSNPTKQHYCAGVRQFIKFLEERGLVERDTHELVKYHKVPKSERQSKNMIEIDRLDGIIDYMERYHPYHRDTILLKILSVTGMRCCGLHSLDVGDVRLDELDRPEIAVRNRPKQGTKLKEGDDHERNVPITKELFDDIKQYVKNQRHDVEDEYGRLPLITSYKGRLSKGAIQDACYKWTHPAHTGGTCACCEGKPNVGKVYSCEYSQGPHAIRGAAVTRFRNGGHTWDDISEMVAAEPEVLKRQYDYADFEDRADRARSLLDCL